MTESLGELISRMFFYGIFATPILAFFIVRKSAESIKAKIIRGIAITIGIAVLFFVIALVLFINYGHFL